MKECIWEETYTNKQPYTNPHYRSSCGKVFNFYDKLTLLRKVCVNCEKQVKVNQNKEVRQ